MKTNIEAPPPRNYAQETRDTLQAQIDLAPKQYASESVYQPLYAQLELRSARDALLGNADTKGLLAMFRDDISPILDATTAASDRAQTASDVSRVSEFGTKIREALRTANPDQASLLDELNRQATSELSLGASLDPSLSRQVQQSARAAQTARGQGFGFSDASEEALFAGQAGEQLRRARQGFGLQVAQLNYATQADPFQALLGRSSSPGLGQGLLGAGLQAGQAGGPQLFNPESPYAADLYNTNYNGQAAARIASANARAGLIGGILGGAGNIFGGLLGGAGAAGGFSKLFR